MLILKSLEGVLEKISLGGEKVHSEPCRLYCIYLTYY